MCLVMVLSDLTFPGTSDIAPPCVISPDDELWPCQEKLINLDNIYWSSWDEIVLFSIVSSVKCCAYGRVLMIGNLNAVTYPDQADIDHWSLTQSSQLTAIINNNSQYQDLIMSKIYFHWQPICPFSSQWIRLKKCEELPVSIPYFPDEDNNYVCSIEIIGKNSPTS